MLQLLGMLKTAAEAAKAAKSAGAGQGAQGGGGMGYGDMMEQVARQKAGSGQLGGGGFTKGAMSYAQAPDVSQQAPSLQSLLGMIGQPQQQAKQQMGQQIHPAILSLLGG